jgi:membrane-associated protease RseP (regulator of RpoE activity)
MVTAAAGRAARAAIVWAAVAATLLAGCEMPNEEQQRGPGPGGRPQRLGLPPQEELDLGREAYAEVLRKYQGRILPDDDPAAEGRDRLGVTAAPGVVVDEVAPGTPAAAAGLARGDVILAVDNAPVVSGEELRLAVHQRAPGAEVTLQVVRGEDSREVKARLDEPAPTPAAP